MPSPQFVSSDDYLSIQRHIGRAADAVTRGDVEQFISSWAENGAWHIGLTRGSLEGREAIHEGFRGIVDSLDAVVQTVENGDAWYANNATDTTEARFYITELVRRKTGESMLLRFFYADRLIRDGEGWLFVERTLNPLYVGPYDLSGPFASSSASYAQL